MRKTRESTGSVPKDARLIPRTIHKFARRKIEMLLKVKRLSDLKTPPKSKLEVLRKELADRHLIEQGHGVHPRRLLEEYEELRGR